MEKIQSNVPYKAFEVPRSILELGRGRWQNPDMGRTKMARRAERYLYEQDVEIKIIEIVVKYNSTNSLGKVESGYIDILGPMRKAQPSKEGQEIDAEGKRILHEGIPVEFQITECWNSRRP
jgi:hypothetical protein